MSTAGGGLHLARGLGWNGEGYWYRSSLLEVNFISGILQYSTVLQCVVVEVIRIVDLHHLAGQDAKQH
jgi:hypothetical protein